MGTSASSSGPGSGIPLVPPWVSDPDVADTTAPADDQGPEQEVADDGGDPVRAPTELAPSGRFKGTRTNLGRFAGSGSADSLERGLGQYVRKGLGGSRRASQRMAGTARKTGALYQALHSLTSGAPPPVDLGIDIASLAGRSALETADRIAAALSPSDGTQDAEASRKSIVLALRELIQREPTADLTALTEQQIEFVMELYIYHDLCRRIELDVGATIFDNAPSAAAAISRFNQMYRYVQQNVAAAFRRQRANSQDLSSQAAKQLASRVIRETFDVFETYLS